MINRRIQYGFIICSLALVSISCKLDNSKTTFDPETVKEEVEAQVWAFYAADTSMNAKAVIDLLWPEYTMLVDGNRVKYYDIVEGSKQFMSSLSLFHAEWTDLEIIPISADAALSSYIFQDSIVYKTGKITRSRGPNTFLWQKRNGEWKVLYGDADHYSLD